MANLATGLKKLAENLGSTLKKPGVTIPTATLAAGGAGGLLTSQIINAGADTPDNYIVVTPQNTTPTPTPTPSAQTDDTSLADMANLLYLMNQSKGGGGGTNVSEPETGNGGGFNIMDYLPWIAGLLGVGLIVYLLFDKKKGRR